MAAIDITPEALSSFHVAHFSDVAVDHFARHFLGPVEESYEKEDENGDGLGYYQDGTKRTLTDEQIAIFRHSEIQTLLRERQNNKNVNEETMKPVPEAARDGKLGAEAKRAAEEAEMEDGEISDQDSKITTPASLTSALDSDQPIKKQKKTHKKERKGRQVRERGWFKQNIKPDLRKRTWDKVETGLENLDYDENHGTPASSGPSQRKRISYDDD